MRASHHVAACGSSPSRDILLELTWHPLVKILLSQLDKHTSQTCEAIGRCACTYKRRCHSEQVCSNVGSATGALMFLFIVLCGTKGGRKEMLSVQSLMLTFFFFNLMLLNSWL